MLKTQIFKSDGENTVFDLLVNNIDSTTVKVYLNHIETNNFTLLPPSFIVLEEAQELNSSVKITFEVKDTEEFIQTDLIKRVVELEKAVEDLLAINNKLLQSVESRVPVKTFNAWKALIESKIGMKIIQTNMTDVGTALVNTTNHK